MAQNSQFLLVGIYRWERIMGALSVINQMLGIGVDKTKQSKHEIPERLIFKSNDAILEWCDKFLDNTIYNGCIYLAQIMQKVPEQKYLNCVEYLIKLPTQEGIIVVRALLPNEIDIAIKGGDNVLVLIDAKSQAIIHKKAKPVFNTRTREIESE